MATKPRPRARNLPEIHLRGADLMFFKIGPIFTVVFALLAIAGLLLSGQYVLAYLDIRDQLTKEERLLRKAEAEEAELRKLVDLSTSQDGMPSEFLRYDGPKPTQEMAQMFRAAVGESFEKRPTISATTKTFSFGITEDVVVLRSQEWPVVARALDGVERLRAAHGDRVRVRRIEFLRASAGGRRPVAAQHGDQVSGVYMPNMNMPESRIYTTGEWVVTFSLMGRS